MSDRVKPATDGQVGRCKETTEDMDRHDSVAVQRDGFLALIARIEQDAEAIRTLTTRAEEAEALLREALESVQGDAKAARAYGFGDLGLKIDDLSDRIEAHLQEHTE